MSTNTRYYYGDGLSYPKQPNYRPICPSRDSCCRTDCCGVNEILKTIPPGFPMEMVTKGPSSMKQLYTGIPNYYPPIKVERPLGSMYDHDLSQFGPWSKRETYHYKIYPLTHLHAREERKYSNYLLPKPNIFEWTKHPVKGYWNS